MPAGFRRHLVLKTLRNVFILLSLKHALFDHLEIFSN